ncbi:hypothetical protein B0O99DRAFT_681737 [Bisporella sp. PMI_857]|nr:hypothetical protein B0O99DRAFT_681737 [Bisporella sp. PMI_857]
MSDQEDTSPMNTGYSTPVPELDDHTHHSPNVQKARSRRGTVNTTHSTMDHTSLSPKLGHVNDELLRTKARDFEEAIVDDETDALSPIAARRLEEKERRGTATTLDRSNSPPSSVKAFAEARRRERELSNTHNARDFAAETRSLNSLHRTVSAISAPSRRTRRYTNESIKNSIASSCKSAASAAEDDVCFPVDNPSYRNGLEINFEALEEFIAEEQERAKTPAAEKSQPHVFHDLRHKQSHTGLVVTSDGDFLSSGSDDVKAEKTVEEASVCHIHGEQLDSNRFEYFSSHAENTIHVNELSDLTMPGEDLRSLFQSLESEEEDGVWWMNMNSPSKDEISIICKAFGIHPLTREDIMTQEAREKIELFPNYYFACFRSFMVENVGSGKTYEPFNIYVVVFREGCLSFSFTPNAHAHHVRQRITNLKDFMAINGDWICYALIDDIVDSFAPVIDDVERETDTIDDQVFVARSDDMNTFLRKIGMARKNVMGLMKLLGGKADVLRGFTKRCNTNYKVTPRMDIGLYLGDIQDHVVTMMTSLGHFEKMLARSHSNYLAQLSIDNITQGNRSNRVLSQITVLASILVPLNLICGIFGMNVKVPWNGVENLHAFWGIISVIIAIPVVFIFTARRLRYL